MVPLDRRSAAPEELAGSGPVRGAAVDPTVATRVLVRGEAQPAATGRADDFTWPRPSGDDAGIIPASVTPPTRPRRRSARQEGAASTGGKDRAEASGAGRRAGTRACSPARPAR